MGVAPLLISLRKEAWWSHLENKSDERMVVNDSAPLEPQDIKDIRRTRKRELCANQYRRIFSLPFLLSFFLPPMLSLFTSFDLFTPSLLYMYTYNRLYIYVQDIVLKAAPSYLRQASNYQHKPNINYHVYVLYTLYIYMKTMYIKYLMPYICIMECLHVEMIWKPCPTSCFTVRIFCLCSL